MNNFNISESAKADIRKKALERTHAIRKVREDYKETHKISDNKPIDNIQFLENVLKACGAENHLHLIHVSRYIICIGTRIPMTAVLHPYATQAKEIKIDNPLFHRVVTEILFKDIGGLHQVVWRKDRDYPELNILEVHFS